MNNLKKIRENQNLTQEELSQLSNVSIRTIQRIEAGTEPKGHTLKLLAKALVVEQDQLIHKQQVNIYNNLSFIKIINLSSLPFLILPPVNLILPLILIYSREIKNELTNHIISIQILWTLLAVTLFILTHLMKNWFSFGNKLSFLVAVFLILINAFIIVRNSAEIDKKAKLYYRLPFNLI